MKKHSGDLPAVSLEHCSTAVLASALEHFGALVLTGLLPAGEVVRAHAEAREALGDPESFARKQQFDPVTRTGYTPPGIERTRRSGPNYRRHFFDYRPDIVALDPTHDYLAPLHARLVAAAERLTALLAPLGLDLRSLIEGGPYVLRIAEGLNAEADPQAEVFGKHQDFGLFTFFVGGSGPGLQIEREGRWIDVDLPAGDVLLGTGTLFTQHYYPAARILPHRVLAQARRRLSLFMFVDPAPHVRLPNGEEVGERQKRILAQIRAA